MDEWTTVLFADESSFSLNTDSRRTFIYREPGTSYLHSNVFEIANYGGGGLMVWAGFMLDGHTPLHVFKRSSMTASVSYLPTPISVTHDHATATAGSDVVQSGRPIFDDFFQHLWPYIGNNTANVVFQMVKRLWLIRIDQ
ncbi:transposable element Tcb2 transposase [Trichonephila clavipes]|nr:transposable element Tcb2 transposase [Trichonephila clavipes]